MAAVFDLDDKRDSRGRSRAEVAAAFDVVIGHVLELPARTAMSEIAGFRGRLDAAETKILAAYVGDDGDTRAAESLAGSTGGSKQATKAKARRAKTAKAAPSLIDKMDSGEMSAEHADVVADTSEKTGGAAAADAGFIDSVAATTVDQAKQIGDDFESDHARSGETQSRYERQRRQRRPARFVTKQGLDAILLKGDREALAAAWNAATLRSNSFYVDDGGRDVPAGQHPRTGDQRMFDAFIALITGTAQPPQPHPDADPVASTADAAGVAVASTTDAAGVPIESSGGQGQARSKIESKRYTPAKNRPVVVIGVTLDKYLGLDPDRVAEMIGTGPIADDVLAQYLTSDPVVVGALYGQNGQPLWLSRTARYATNAQIQALIIRDKCCANCSESYLKCDAHHLMPWNAPAQGETDITKLALLCGPCHRWLHNNNLTLYRDRLTGRWKTRPATPNETPPQPLRTGDRPQRE